MERLIALPRNLFSRHAGADITENVARRAVILQTTPGLPPTSCCSAFVCNLGAENPIRTVPLRGWRPCFLRYFIAIKWSAEQSPILIEARAKDRLAPILHLTLKLEECRESVGV